MRDFIKLFLLTGLIIAGCKIRSEFYNRETSVVKFGCGGGFTGNISTCQLNGKGKFFQFNSMGGDSTYYKNVGKNELKEIEKMVKDDSLKTVSIEESGNMTCFLEIMEKDKIKYRYTWPQGSKTVPGPVLRLFNYLENMKK